MILVGHDKRSFSSQNNITKVTTSMVQWLRFFHDHHSLYITTAYCILMRRFYKFLSKSIFHWFDYFVVSFRSIRVNIFTVNIIRGHSKSTFIIGAGGGGSLKSQQKRTGRGGSIVCVYVLFFFKKNAEISKMKFYSYSFTVFLLIIKAMRNIKQTIMKEYNIQSCQ